MKPTKKIKLKMGRKGKAGKKAATTPRLPRWIWSVGGAVALVIVIAWFMLVPAQKKAPPAPPPSRSAGTEGSPNRQPPASAAAPAARIPEKPLAFLQTVRLQPSEPTRLDTLTAAVEVASGAPGPLTYAYLWKVNDRIIEEATGDTLNLSPFKKQDLVTVTVTPHDGDIAGFAVESPVVAIHSVPPSLALKAVRQARKIGDPIELQLVGAAPDGNLVAFSLEAPHVPGMTIDKHSGKISWRRQPNQKGTFRFGAAVEDDNRTKVTKIFAVTVE
ncbi:MAG: hypothetical protein HY742_02780 [Deltaproteobacteria bacterium]|nr:hypothetical protein [Deltaproteobacteria bacterium]